MLHLSLILTILSFYFFAILLVPAAICTNGIPARESKLWQRCAPHNMGLRFVRSNSGTGAVACLLCLSIALLFIIFYNVRFPITTNCGDTDTIVTWFIKKVCNELKGLSDNPVRNIIAIFYLVLHICLYITLLVRPLETPVQRLATAGAFGASCFVAVMKIFNFWTFVCLVLAAPLDIIIMCAMIANPSGRLNKMWIPLYLTHTPTHFGGAAETNQTVINGHSAEYGAWSPMSARLAKSHPSAIASAPDVFELTSPAVVIEI